MLFIADELDSVFRFAPSIGHAISGEIAQIGDSREGRTHCIISGSSSHLRQLCFCNLPVDDEKQVPSYNKCFDQNSAKFSTQWIYPFLKRMTFAQLSVYCKKILLNLMNLQW